MNWISNLFLNGMLPASVTLRAIGFLPKRLRRGHETVTDKLKLPSFSSETEEAQWWYDHREELTKAFVEAAARGELRTGSVAKFARQPATGITPTTTIRLDPQDISRARALAARRGVRYQTYLKMLLHEALATEEKKLAS
jgi:hypothetical protein